MQLSRQQAGSSCTPLRFGQQRALVVPRPLQRRPARIDAKFGGGSSEDAARRALEVRHMDAQTCLRQRGPPAVAQLLVLPRCSVCVDVAVRCL